MTRFLLAVFILTCSTAFSQSNKPGAEISYSEMEADSIEIRGKFLEGCKMPGTIQIALQNVDDSRWKDIPVNTSGEFTYRHFLTEPRRIALRTASATKFDFFATSLEKVYQIEIGCDKGIENFWVKGSEENAAYLPFSGANKKLQTDLDSFSKRDISNKTEFRLLTKILADYQTVLANIASAHPGTFTAKVFCAAEKLPERALNSPEALRKNFLKREAFSNPQIYNDFLAQRILLNYLAIRDKNADANETIETLMGIALKNAIAAKRLQDAMNTIFYKMQEENLMTAYINWADRNPGKMYSLSVKARLQNLKKIVAGNPMIDFELKDTSGQLRKLSETVYSGKLTVLIFYSPTCGHCKKKVPELIPLWDQYKSQGLKIYAAGNDATNEEWHSFIKNNSKPEWVHVFEYEDGPRPTNLYYTENPTFILIDAQGKIVSRIGNLEHVKEEIRKRMEMK